MGQQAVTTREETVRKLTRRQWMTGAVGAALTAPRLNAQYFPPGEFSTRAVDLVLSSGAIDMLGLITSDWAKLRRWRTSPVSFGPEDLSTIRASGVAMFHPAVNLPGDAPALPTERWLRDWDRFCSFHPEAFTIVRRAADIDRASASGPAGILLGVQNSTHFSTVADVTRFAKLGQRVSQLTYNGQNCLGCGCHSARDSGLTAFGAEIVAAMNREGMLVDVSHCGPRTTLDAVEVSSQPVVVSHSNCLTLTPGEPRCKSDEIIQRLAAKGGVIGLTGIRKFVAARGRSTLDELLNHFDHVRRLVGVEHLGIGSDADLEGREPVISELAHHGFLYAITDGLLRRGYTSSEIRLILAGNFGRLLRQALPV